MKRTAWLAWCALRANRVQSLAIVIALAAIIAVPLGSAWLIARYEQAVSARADSTPLLLSARGSRFDHTLHALYFAPRIEAHIAMAEWDALAELAPEHSYPIDSAASLDDAPVVGTDLGYFSWRGLRPARGTLPLHLGEVMLGASLAANTGLAVDDRITVDVERSLSIDGAFPLQLRVCGIFAATGTADDGAAFTSLATSWVLRGAGHVHDQPDTEAGTALSSSAGVITANASLREERDLFAAGKRVHFHGGEDQRQVTAILIEPGDERRAALIKAHYLPNQQLDILAPPQVVAELFGLAVRIKRLFDAQYLVLAAVCTLLLALVLWLSLRLRRDEFTALRRLGATRATLAAIAAWEWLVLLLAALTLALLTSYAAVAILQGILFSTGATT